MLPASLPGPVLERLMCRTWLRDGEVFAQLVSGTGNGLSPVAEIPFWIEALEPDFVPMERTETGQKLCQGIYLNDWGRPTRYMVYKTCRRKACGRVIQGYSGGEHASPEVYAPPASNPG
jgi:capsid protein